MTKMIAKKTTRSLPAELEPNVPTLSALWSHFRQLVHLLFFHRKLCLELYLRWLEEHEQQPAEEPPIGLILCASRSEEKVRLLRLDQGNIRVAGGCRTAERRIEHLCPGA